MLLKYILDFDISFSVENQKKAFIVGSQSWYFMGKMHGEGTLCLIICGKTLFQD
jgi:hypothetical protein